ncbi:hypothetical protein Xen7305DRAFT_00028350, partial [Xenococcus sp. PCC 7305]|uniref:hypothetical protein n=1 Tax=Xenococcus sp. PCC 7305 TaxID=102125 RepID=UPI0002ACC2ED
ERDFVRVLERDLEQDFVQDFSKQIVRVKLYLFLLENGETPEIKTDQVSQLLHEQFKQTFEIELSQHSNLIESQVLFTDEQKQAKLIQFSILAILSFTGLMISLVLLARQRNQGITWSMTAMCLLPEECVGELSVLYEQLQTKHKSATTIRLIMLWNILVLLKSIYIQVAIEDLFLPSRNKRD